LKKNLRIALAQINCIVGDLDGNAAKIIQYIRRAEGFCVDIICFPELALTGYPPEDLLLKPKFVDDNLKKLKELSRAVADTVAIVGFVDRKSRDIFNAAAVIYKGKVCGIYHKMHLPNYGVFDEKRYFTPGENPMVFRWGSPPHQCIGVGVNICEDIWQECGPINKQALCGAKLILNINASPFYAGKTSEREKLVRGQAKQNRLFICYTNLVGGQDELVFDGQSLIADNAGRVVAKAEAFQEDLLIADLAIPEGKLSRSKKVITITERVVIKHKPRLPKKDRKPLSPIALDYQALVLGLRDYVTKNGFKKVVIGLSGGIDSALVGVLAVDALEAENVIGVFMPSRYSSHESEADAAGLARNLGIKLLNIPIERLYKAYLMVLKPHFLRLKKNIAEENLQARIRGNILMALSNKFGWLVLATGNKSEMSTGYATLYGDMAGGFAVIKDVPKILVYKLAKYRNARHNVLSGALSFLIPQRVITKEPTAELKPNQKDTDTLPPYETLDRILKAYVEADKDLTKIISLGFDKETVLRVLRMVDRSEYKRRQSPPGIKITPKAFGRDRRMPITNRYRG